MVKTAPELSISSEKLCFIIVKAREFEEEDVLAEDASSDDGESVASRAADNAGNAVRDELAGFINALTEDEQIDLVALAWLGRGDGTTDDWDDLRAEAARAHNRRTARYVLGMPLLPDYLEEALSQLGLSCEDYEIGRL
jgi:hypothetical protein